MIMLSMLRFLQINCHLKSQLKTLSNLYHLKLCYTFWSKIGCWLHCMESRVKSLSLQSQYSMSNLQSCHIDILIFVHHCRSDNEFPQGPDLWRYLHLRNLLIALGYMSLTKMENFHCRIQLKLSQWLYKYFLLSRYH